MSRPDALQPQPRAYRRGDRVSLEREGRDRRFGTVQHDQIYEDEDLVYVRFDGDDPLFDSNHVHLAQDLTLLLPNTFTYFP
jgi:hypothetical protein